MGGPPGRCCSPDLSVRAAHPPMDPPGLKRPRKAVPPPRPGWAPRLPPQSWGRQHQRPEPPPANELPRGDPGAGDHTLTTGNGWQSRSSSCSSTFLLTSPGNCTIPQNLRGRHAVSASAHGRAPRAAAAPSAASRPSPSRPDLRGQGLHRPTGPGHVRAGLGMPQWLPRGSGDRLCPPPAAHRPAPAPRPPAPAVMWDSHRDAGPQLLHVLGLVGLRLTKLKQLHAEGVAAREAQGTVLTRTLHRPSSADHPNPSSRPLDGRAGLGGPSSAAAPAGPENKHSLLLLGEDVKAPVGQQLVQHPEQRHRHPEGRGHP